MCKGRAIDGGANGIFVSGHGGGPRVSALAAFRQAGIEGLPDLCSAEMRVVLMLARIWGVDRLDRSMHV